MGTFHTVLNARGDLCRPRGRVGTWASQPQLRRCPASRIFSETHSSFIHRPRARRIGPVSRPGLKEDRLPKRSLKACEILLCSRLRYWGKRQIGHEAAGKRIFRILNSTAKDAIGSIRHTAVSSHEVSIPSTHTDVIPWDISIAASEGNVKYFLHSSGERKG